jgi:hypothetical protein
VIEPFHNNVFSAAQDGTPEQLIETGYSLIAVGLKRYRDAGMNEEALFELEALMKILREDWLPLYKLVNA